jgi:TRAP-type C4-dicarboxylate transport system permease small subunit
VIGLLIAPVVAAVALFVAWLFALVAWDQAVAWWNDPTETPLRIFLAGLFVCFGLLVAFHLVRALIDRLRGRRR